MSLENNFESSENLSVQDKIDIIDTLDQFNENEKLILKMLIIDKIRQGMIVWLGNYCQNLIAAHGINRLALRQPNLIKLSKKAAKLTIDDPDFKHSNEAVIGKDLVLRRGMATIKSIAKQLGVDTERLNKLIDYVFETETYW